ncbi:MAG: hypothetical protein RDU59_04585 [Thermodesulfobacteriota bacterium]|nr:hypothetical protein [Thermodesulfobacteriota bacterium]
MHFTRSRAYHKDDNAHIEQKNWTHVRQWLGYERLDNPHVVPLLNDLYAKEWRLFHNFFCPSVKLIAKERIASKTIKRHDSPKTPYQRIMESPHIQKSVKSPLSKQLEKLNPFLLRKNMDKKLKKSLPSSTTLGNIFYESMLIPHITPSVTFNYEATGGCELLGVVSPDLLANSVFFYPYLGSWMQNGSR